MNNDEFFAAVNQRIGFEYVKNPAEQDVVRTRDTVDDFLKNWELDESVKTDTHTIHTFITDSRELIVIDDGEFRYTWKD